MAASPCFIIGAQFVYTQLHDTTHAGEPVYKCNKDSLYLFRTGPTWTSGQCAGDQFDDKIVKPVWSCTGDPRQEGKHRWMSVADGAKGKYQTRIMHQCEEASCKIDGASLHMGIRHHSKSSADDATEKQHVDDLLSGTYSHFNVVNRSRLIVNAREGVATLKSSRKSST